MKKGGGKEMKVTDPSGKEINLTDSIVVIGDKIFQIIKDSHSGSVARYRAERHINKCTKKTYLYTPRQEFEFKSRVMDHLYENYRREINKIGYSTDILSEIRYRVTYGKAINNMDLTDRKKRRE